MSSVSGTGSVFTFGSLSGFEVQDADDCAPETEEYKTVSQLIHENLHNNPNKNIQEVTQLRANLQENIQAEMELAFTKELIEEIEKKLEPAKISQTVTEEENNYFIKLFELYKEHLDEKREDEHLFSLKLELLKRVVYTSRLPTAKHSVSNRIKFSNTEKQDRKFGKNDRFTIKNMFEDSRDSYKRYLLTKFNRLLYHDHTRIREAINNAFTSLQRGEPISREYFCCKRIIETESRKRFVFYLSITDKKIELRCSLEDEDSKKNGPVYECSYYISNDGNSLLFVAKITGKPSFRNIHITQVYPLINRNANKSYASPHITFAHTGTNPEERLYIDYNSNARGFSLSQVWGFVNNYITHPDKTTKSLFLSMNSKYIEELETLLKNNKKKIQDIERSFEERERQERERQKRLRQKREEHQGYVGTGGSTNKILKIKEQIKIIKAKYKTTKLDKYLIQIDKLKEKIEQIKLKDKKNKIKEQIKELKALHKLNPKKAYVNKMIKLKEKLSNM